MAKKTYDPQAPLTLRMTQEEADHALGNMVDMLDRMLYKFEAKPCEDWDDDTLERLGESAIAVGRLSVALGVAKLHLTYDTKVHEPGDPPSVNVQKATEAITAYLGDPAHQMTLGLHIPDVPDTGLAVFLMRLLAACWPGGDGSMPAEKPAAT